MILYLAPTSHQLDALLASRQASRLSPSFAQRCSWVSLHAVVLIFTPQVVIFVNMLVK